MTRPITDRQEAVARSRNSRPVYEVENSFNPLNLFAILMTVGVPKVEMLRLAANYEPFYAHNKEVFLQGNGYHQ